MEKEFMALFPATTEVQLIQKGDNMSTVMGNARTVPTGGEVIYKNQKLFRTMGTPSKPGYVAFCDEDGNIVEVERQPARQLQREGTRPVTPAVGRPLVRERGGLE